MQLSTFEDWKHCITVECAIPLTQAFIEQRLAALRNPRDLHTQKFVAEWGQGHLDQVVEWFEMARAINTPPQANGSGLARG